MAGCLQEAPLTKVCELVGLGEVFKRALQCAKLFTLLAGDLLYLRDEEEKRRFQEVELRDSERSQASIADSKTWEKTRAGWQACSKLVGVLPLTNNVLCLDGPDEAVWTLLLIWPHAA